jgi:membrane protease YdiL (CAAX protease family)
MGSVTPMASTRADWLRSAGMIGGIYICPVVLLVTGVIPFEWRFHVLVAMALLAAGIAALSRRHTAIGLGLTVPRFRALMSWSILPSALLIGAIILADLPHRHLASGRTAFYLFFVLVSAPAQEFLYRSFLFAELREIRIPPAAIVLVSTLLFSFMHIIYRDSVTMLLTLVAGLIWAVVFHMTQKVWLVAVSHAALGVAAIITGVI